MNKKKHVLLLLFTICNVIIIPFYSSAESYDEQNNIRVTKSRSAIDIESEINTLLNTPDIIEEGFVAFATRSYFPILEVLIKSVHAFSTRPIVVFGINDDIPFSTTKYPHLIKKRIDVNLNEFHIFYQKPRIIAHSGIKYGIYVEADDIVAPNIDEMFTWCKNVQDYPLCPIHPNNVNVLPDIMQSIGVKNKSMPYVHGHIVFAPSCKHFILEWLKACYMYKEVASKQNYDESILNVLLWKYNAVTYLPPYDPFCTLYVDYINNKNGNHTINYCDNNIVPFMFHGAKNIQIAEK